MRSIKELEAVVKDILLKCCPACGNEAKWTFQRCSGGRWNCRDVIMAHLGCKTFKCLQVMPQQFGIDEQLIDMAEIWNRRDENIKQ